MWILFLILGSLFFFGIGPAVAVYGFVVVIRRRVGLTRTHTLQREQAVATGFLTILLGIAFFVLQVYWTIENYPREW